MLNLSFATRAFTATLLGFTLLTGCQSDENKPALSIPTQYDSTNFTTNTTVQAAVRSQLAAFVAEAQKGRNIANKLNYNTLTQLYNAGSPSLKSITTPYYAAKVDGTGQWLDMMSKASGNNYTPAPPTANSVGGVYGGYLFDANGLEIEQMIDKGLYGATLYNHAITLMSQPLTAATADQLVSIFGASPEFPNTNTASKTQNPDRFMALYAARRDKNDGKGLYTQQKANFIKLQAAIKAGSKYKQEQDEALAAIKLTWEKANAATIINYCHAVISTMSSTNPTDAQKGAALHAYGEAVGFIHGWRTLPQQHKRITDSQIDAILTLLNAPANGTPTSYKFITEPVSELPKLNQIITQLKGIYGFTDAEIEDFKNNWVALQGR